MRHLAILACALTVALAACEREPDATTPPPKTTANNWKITKLFEFDGCTAYYAYGQNSGFDSFKYVVCDRNGGSVRTEWEHSYSVGKMRHHETVSVDQVARE